MTPSPAVGRINAAIRVHIFQQWNPRNSWALAICGASGRGRLVLHKERPKCETCFAGKQQEYANDEL